MEGRYQPTEGDYEMVAAARLLLEKVTLGKLARPAELVTVAKLMHALDRFPEPIGGVAATITITGPRRRHGDVEIYHWWRVSLQYAELVIESGGYYYRPPTGGDSFTTVHWVSQPGELTSREDYLQELWMVPGILPFERAVRALDVGANGVQLDAEDADNPLLADESDDDDEEYDEPDEDEAEAPIEEATTLNPHDDSQSNAPAIDPVDEAERELAGRAERAIAAHREAEYAYGAERCDMCRRSFETCGLFVDGATSTGAWANMCATCFQREGTGLGWGRGQLYARQRNGDWRLVGGIAGRPQPLDE